MDHPDPHPGLRRRLLHAPKVLSPSSLSEVDAITWLLPLVTMLRERRGKNGESGGESGVFRLYCEGSDIGCLFSAAFCSDGKASVLTSTPGGTLALDEVSRMAAGDEGSWEASTGTGSGVGRMKTKAEAYDMETARKCCTVANVAVGNVIVDNVAVGNVIVDNVAMGNVIVDNAAADNVVVDNVVVDNDVAVDNVAGDNVKVVALDMMVSIRS
ncbi:hypothetical protein BCR41DRAFT_387999 [Lobosporangium transversale]|uniref:Uncharacterized protein n=1 Tax=Lobosporangium transversale TaxID=64571 RepID=A0A1Y2GII6_9FUNG|nr:hypothetical protein BCR41DRAFT_387999 [Lobosporangium transversale]ORZ10683.1 hypothetical protein BCR41DRAFT_387999 [Lobosporangium transversale]|eukprot:XP_021879404.1 hypothetical protein BCR41DRAFT_387999 [Lobosporangium transversale]